LNVIASTPNAINTIPNALIPYSPFTPANATNFRRIEMDTLRLLPGSTPNRAEGPFGLNNKSFHMDSINEVVYLNTTEIWTIVNKTLVAHPFHMHDIQFNIIEKNGQAPIPSEKGWKDVVLVMPGDSVKFITKFETFTNPTVPYMYHCHLLHHEDDGMMGSFIVIDSAWAAGTPLIEKINEFEIYPNPTKDNIYIYNKTNQTEIENIYISDLSGRKLLEYNFTIKAIDISNLFAGVYYLTVATKNKKAIFKIIRQ
jgi:bilirubin oxidase